MKRKKYKVVTYVEKSLADDYLKEIKEKTLNQIGNYTNCISIAEVISCWTSLKNAYPIVGRPNTKSIESEMRIEMLVEKKDLKRVVSVLRAYHPYETPEIDVYEIKAE